MYAFCFSNLESSMRTHVLAAGLFSLISAFAMADGDAVIRSTPAQRAAIQTQFMKERLKLPADVLAKVQAIDLKQVLAASWRTLKTLITQALEQDR
jgi:hypothetical protein